MGGDTMQRNNDLNHILDVGNLWCFSEPMEARFEWNLRTRLRRARKQEDASAN